MGCNRLGESHEPDHFWIDLVRRAVDHGVNIFDTASRYGEGRSEAILGEAVGHRDDVYIATKLSQGDKSERDFSAAHMARMVEQSLRKLKREAIDIYQLHSPSREDMEQFDWIEGMERLHQQGKIRLRAVAVNSVQDGIWLVEEGLVDVLQITYNIFDTSAEERLLDLAQASDVGLLCRRPLERGILTGKFRPDDVDTARTHRARLQGDRLAEQIRLAEDLRPLGSEYPGGMTRMAHHFCLSQPAITCIIPGARTIMQLEENVAASNGVGLPPRIREEIDRVTAAW